MFNFQNLQNLTCSIFKNSFSQGWRFVHYILTCPVWERMAAIT